MTEVYLDNSATTKPYKEAIDQMTHMLTHTYGNPSSLYRLGQESRQKMADARKIIANSLAVTPEEIYFTSGGTESNNIAITGTCLANAELGNHIVTSVAEHPSVTKTIRILRRKGWHVSYIPAPHGVLDLEELEKAITKQTVLVSIMVVNNETGAIFPVEKIKAIIRKKQSPALLHCDAVQAYGKLPFTAEEIGADILSMSAHKINGIKGAGALYVKKESNVFPIMFGGDQEKALRPGTESTPAIAAFGQAARITFDNFAENTAHLTELRDYCLDRLTRDIETAVVHSTKNGAPHIVNFSIQNFFNQDVVHYLSDKNIFIGSGAACKSNHARSPSMLESLGLTRELAKGALRVSFSTFNKKSDVDQLIDALTKMIELKK